MFRDLGRVHIASFVVGITGLVIGIIGIVLAIVFGTAQHTCSPVAPSCPPATSLPCATNLFSIQTGVQGIQWQDSYKDTTNPDTQNLIAKIQNNLTNTLNSGLNPGVVSTSSEFGLFLASDNGGPLSNSTVIKISTLMPGSDGQTVIAVGNGAVSSAVDVGALPQPELVMQVIKNDTTQYKPDTVKTNPSVCTFTNTTEITPTCAPTTDCPTLAPISSLAPASCPPVTCPTPPPAPPTTCPTLPVVTCPTVTCPTATCPTSAPTTCPKCPPCSSDAPTTCPVCPTVTSCPPCSSDSPSTTTCPICPPIPTLPCSTNLFSVATGVAGLSWDPKFSDPTDPFTINVLNEIQKNLTSALNDGLNQQVPTANWFHVRPHISGPTSNNSVVQVQRLEKNADNVVIAYGNGAISSSSDVSMLPNQDQVKNVIVNDPSQFVPATVQTAQQVCSLTQQAPTTQSPSPSPGTTVTSPTQPSQSTQTVQSSTSQGTTPGITNTITITPSTQKSTQGVVTSTIFPNTQSTQSTTPGIVTTVSQGSSPATTPSTPGTSHTSQTSQKVTTSQATSQTTQGSPSTSQSLSTSQGTSATTPRYSGTSQTPLTSQRTSSTTPGSHSTSQSLPTSQGTSPTTQGSLGTSQTTPTSQGTTPTTPGSSGTSQTPLTSQGTSPTTPGSPGTSQTTQTAQTAPTSQGTSQGTSPTTPGSQTSSQSTPGSPSTSLPTPHGSSSTSWPSVPTIGPDQCYYQSNIAVVVELTDPYVDPDQKIQNFVTNTLLFYPGNPYQLGGADSAMTKLALVPYPTYTSLEGLMTYGSADNQEKITTLFKDFALFAGPDPNIFEALDYISTLTYTGVPGFVIVIGNNGSQIANSIASSTKLQNAGFNVMTIGYDTSSDFSPLASNSQWAFNIGKDSDEIVVAKTIGQILNSTFCSPATTPASTITPISTASQGTSQSTPGTQNTSQTPLTSQGTSPTTPGSSSSSQTSPIATSSAAPSTLAPDTPYYQGDVAVIFELVDQTPTPLQHFVANNLFFYQGSPYQFGSLNDGKTALSLIPYTAPVQLVPLMAYGQATTSGEISNAIGLFSSLAETPTNISSAFEILPTVKAPANRKPGFVILVGSDDSSVAAASASAADLTNKGYQIITIAYKTTGSFDSLASQPGYAFKISQDSDDASVSSQIGNILNSTFWSTVTTVSPATVVTLPSSTVGSTVTQPSMGSSTVAQTGTSSSMGPTVTSPGSTVSQSTMGSSTVTQTGTSSSMGPTVTSPGSTVTQPTIMSSTVTQSGSSSSLGSTVSPSGSTVTQPTMVSSTVTQSGSTVTQSSVASSTISQAGSTATQTGSTGFQTTTGSSSSMTPTVTQPSTPPATTGSTTSQICANQQTVFQGQLGVIFELLPPSSSTQQSVVNSFVENILLNSNHYGLAVDNLDGLNRTLATPIPYPSTSKYNVQGYGSSRSQAQFKSQVEGFNGMIQPVISGTSDISDALLYVISSLPANNQPSALIIVGNSKAMLDASASVLASQLKDSGFSIYTVSVGDDPVDLSGLASGPDYSFSGATQSNAAQIASKLTASSPAVYCPPPIPSTLAPSTSTSVVPTTTKLTTTPTVTSTTTVTTPTLGPCECQGRWVYDGDLAIAFEFIRDSAGSESITSFLNYTLLKDPSAYGLGKDVNGNQPSKLELFPYPETDRYPSYTYGTIDSPSRLQDILTVMGPPLQTEETNPEISDALNLIKSNPGPSKVKTILLVGADSTNVASTVDLANTLKGQGYNIITVAQTAPASAFSPLASGSQFALHIGDGQDDQVAANIASLLLDISFTCFDDGTTTGAPITRCPPTLGTLGTTVSMSTVGSTVSGTMSSTVSSGSSTSQTPGSTVSGTVSSGTTVSQGSTVSSGSSTSGSTVSSGSSTTQAPGSTVSGTSGSTVAQGSTVSSGPSTSQTPGSTVSGTMSSSVSQGSTMSSSSTVSQGSTLSSASSTTQTPGSTVSGSSTVSSGTTVSQGSTVSFGPSTSQTSGSTVSGSSTVSSGTTVSSASSTSQATGSTFSGSTGSTPSQGPTASSGSTQTVTMSTTVSSSTPIPTAPYTGSIVVIFELNTAQTEVQPVGTFVRDNLFNSANYDFSGPTQAINVPYPDTVSVATDILNFGVAKSLADLQANIDTLIFDATLKTTPRISDGLEWLMKNRNNPVGNILIIVGYHNDEDSGSTRNNLQQLRLSGYQVMSVAVGSGHGDLSSIADKPEWYFQVDDTNGQAVANRISSILANLGSNTPGSTLSTVSYASSTSGSTVSSGSITTQAPGSTVSGSTGSTTSQGSTVSSGPSTSQAPGSTVSGTMSSTVSQGSTISSGSSTSGSTVSSGSSTNQTPGSTVSGTIGSTVSQGSTVSSASSTSQAPGSTVSGTMSSTVSQGSTVSSGSSTSKSTVSSVPSTTQTPGSTVSGSSTVSSSSTVSQGSTVSSIPITTQTSGSTISGTMSSTVSQVSTISSGSSTSGSTVFSGPSTTQTPGSTVSGSSTVSSATTVSSGSSTSQSPGTTVSGSTASPATQGSTLSSSPSASTVSPTVGSTVVSTVNTVASSMSTVPSTVSQSSTVSFGSTAPPKCANTYSGKISVVFELNGIQDEVKPVGSFVRDNLFNSANYDFSGPTQAINVPYGDTDSYLTEDFLNFGDAKSLADLQANIDTLIHNATSTDIHAISVGLDWLIENRKDPGNILIIVGYHDDTNPAATSQSLNQLKKNNGYQVMSVAVGSGHGDLSSVADKPEWYFQVDDTNGQAVADQISSILCNMSNV